MVMADETRFDVAYAREVKRHLRHVDAKYHCLIEAAIELQLVFEPDVETRNRKPLKRPTSFGADWELRCGADNRFRVFYQVNAELMSCTSWQSASKTAAVC